jgi:hypothetical protein
MKVFYSILYVSIKPVVNEQLSIGLFLSDGNSAFFHYSVEKLNLTRKLISDDSFSMISQYIDGLNQDINGEEKYFKDISLGYFNYLSDYNNNLISFSKPTPININFEEEVFKKLFEKFVFKYKSEVVPLVHKVTPLSRVKEVLYPSIKRRVNIDKTLTPKEIPTLLVPRVKVDFIGLNDYPVAGDVIDFNAGINSISNNIGHFTTLINALDGRNGKYYIIGEEPSRTLYPEQHSTWSQIHNSKSIEFVPLNEIETVSKYMEDHKVKPFVTDN